VVAKPQSNIIHSPAISNKNDVPHRTVLGCGPPEPKTITRGIRHLLFSVKFANVSF
jgi:hypothetical protein